MKTNTKRGLAAGLIAGSLALTGLATSTISQFEGRKLQAYQDIVHVWTICDGETNGVHKGQTKTPAECDQILAKNLVIYENGIDRCLTWAVPGESKVAFLSLAYNIGVGAFCSSSVVRKANAGDVPGACESILAFNKGRIAGILVVIPGLDKRRHAERDLCIAGTKAA